LLSGDVDGDGDAELLAGHFAFNSLTLLGKDAIGVVNQERYELPGFGSNLDFNREVGASNAIALGDLNGDGCIDLVGATYSGVMALYGCEPFVPDLPVSDFDGDGVSDLLWRYEGTGENYLWRWADARSWHECANLPCSPPMGFEWSAQAVGDFDGDGNSDVFWRDHASGANEIRMSSVYRRSIAGVASQAWQVLGAGDFDGDDRSDLFWRHSKNGANYIWRSADASTKQAVPGVTDQRWEVVGIGDFDGDGQSDLFWRHAGSGRNVVWWEGSGARRKEVARVSNLAWKVAGVGDFNNDGRDDLAWRNGSSGANTIWLSANGSTQRAVRGVTNLAWRIAAVGDYNGDGYSDLMWRNGATGANVIWRSADARLQQTVESRGVGFEPIR
jgi:hypothetical protein